MTTETDIDWTPEDEPVEVVTPADLLPEENDEAELDTDEYDYYDEYVCSCFDDWDDDEDDE